MLRKVVASLVLFLLVIVSPAAAGNFGPFNTLAINTLKLTPGPEVNGFKMYKSGGESFLLGILPTKDWIIEAFVICKGTGYVDDFVKAVAVIYSQVQETRYHLRHQQDAEIIMQGGVKLWEARAKEVIASSYKQLYHTDVAAFDFDNIKVKCQDIGEVKWRQQDKNREYDAKKMISIKFWIQ